MLEELPANTVRYGHKLTAVKRNTDGTVRLSFQVGNTTVDQTADRAILALPFTTLRDCDLSQSGFSALKLRTIDEVGLGANAKVHVQVSHRPWVEQGYGGAAYTNKSGFQCGWDDTADHPLPTGVFNFFPSGDQVKAWTGTAFGPARAAQVTGLLAQLEPIFPGMTAAYTGKSYRDFWWANPWSKGAYTCQRPGQYTDAVRRRRDARGQRALRRRAHQRRVLRLPERRGRVGRAGGEGGRPAVSRARRVTDAARHPSPALRACSRYARQTCTTEGRGAADEPVSGGAAARSRGSTSSARRPCRSRPGAARRRRPCPPGRG